VSRSARHLPPPGHRPSLSAHPALPAQPAHGHRPELPQVKPSPAVRTVRAASLAALAAATLAGCSTTEGLFSSEKVDYRSQAGKTAPLDVPPDLTQMVRDGRYQAPSGVVSASTLRQPGATAPAAGPTAGPGGNAVAPTAAGDVKLMRDGGQRWLTSPESPDKLFPILRSFWAERGFVVVTDSPEVGVLETDWAENRAKLPQDILRRSLGRVIDSFYSTGERDKFRTRVERNAAGGSDIFLVHRGMEEVYDNDRKERTIWQARPRDPDLEAEMLGRMMVRLGGKEDAARTALGSAATTPVANTAARSTGARAAAALPATATVAVNEGFDRAWRIVGVALDRSGFTVEDRDRSAGLYFVRYIDPRLAGKEEPNFFQKLFSRDTDTRPGRYRVLVQSTNASTTQVTVQNSGGTMDNSEPARQIIGRLIEEMQPR